ncbi:MAG: multidrug transporter [Pseudomonadales bacterium]|nr:multidrug transporter [Pseudomonadales bacterium]
MQAMFRRIAAALALATTLSAGMPAQAQNAVVRENPPGPGSMAADLIVARPIGLAATVLGTATFIVSLPFSLAGGNVSEATEALVMGPARTTFYRCLGCRNPGWRDDYGGQR